ncbi:MAG: uroporphyrinogen-III synthase [Ignavibacteria bacterium]|nr:uroporphyrinogen-III synthase [Ignavibacteria bacterium]
MNKNFEEKRELIIEVATPLFSSKDFHEVNMELIAQKASIAKGTIYNYFKSKDELYFSIIHSRLSKLITELKKNFKLQADVWNDLSEFVAHIFSFMMKYQNFFVVFQKSKFNIQKLNQPELDSLISELKQMLINIIDEGIDSEKFRKCDSSLTADFILGIIFSTVQRNLNKDYNEFEVEKERDELIRFIKNGLKNSNIKKPLEGKVILLTRTLGQSDESAKVFEEQGAEVIVLPTLKIVPPLSWQKCDEAIKKLTEFSAIIFTNANAVDWFYRRMQYLDSDFDFKNLMVIAIGQKTAECCKMHNIPISFILKDLTSEGMIRTLESLDLKGKNILITQSHVERDELTERLYKLGAKATRVDCYDVIVPKIEDISEVIIEMNSKDIDVYVFTSPSTFKNYLEIFRIENPKEYFADKVIAAIGPATKNEISSHNIEVKIMPTQFTLQGLVQSIINFFTTN